MLNEKEEKAIERLKERINDSEDYKTVQVWLTDDVVAVNTVLNLITKLQKENEEYKYLYQKALDNTIKSDRKNIELKKENEELKATINKQSLDISNNLLELKQKDKQICELVKYIDSNNYVDSEECQFQEDFKIKCIGNGDCIDCIKQYFATKAKEKGE